MCLGMRVGQKSAEREERVFPYPDFPGRERRFRKLGNWIFRTENSGEEPVGNDRESELRQAEVVRMGDADRKYVRIPKDFPNARRKFGMEIGNEEHGGFRTDFFGDLAHGDAAGTKGRKRGEIVTERSGETADVDVRKRGFQNADAVSSVGDGSCTVAGSYRARGYEFENRQGRVEPSGSGFSEPHGRGNVDNAPNGNFAIGNEGLHQGLSAAQTRFPIYRTGVVGLGVRTESSEFYPLSGKYRSMLSRGKRYGVTEFGKVEKTHGFGKLWNGKLPYDRVADFQAVEHDFAGCGNMPHGEDSSFGKGGFHGTAGTFFDEEPVCRIVETEDPGDVYGFDRHLRERAAFFAVFLLARLVSGIVGSRHRHGFDGPGKGFETAGALVQVSEESDDRSGFGKPGDRPASCGKLRHGGVGGFRIGVRIFEVVHEGSGYGNRARSRQGFVAVFGFSEIVAGDPGFYGQSVGFALGDGLYGDERARRRNFGRNVDASAGFRLEIERSRPG